MLPPLWRISGKHNKNRRKTEDKPKNPYNVRKHHSSWRSRKCKHSGHNARPCTTKVKPEKGSGNMRQKIPVKGGKGTLQLHKNRGAVIGSDKDKAVGSRVVARNVGCSGKGKVLASTPSFVGRSNPIRASNPRSSVASCGNNSTSQGETSASTPRVGGLEQALQDHLLHLGKANPLGREKHQHAQTPKDQAID